MGVTAQRSAANPDSPQNLGLIPHTDLTQFNTGFKHSRQILHQFPEINTTIRSKIEQNLIVVKSIFRIYQFHLQTMLLDLFKTDLKGILLFPLVGCLLLLVSLVGDSQYRFKRLNHLVIFHFPGIADCRAELNASGSLHNHVFPSLYIKMQRVKKINLTRGAKPDSNYFYHLYTSLC